MLLGIKQFFRERSTKLYSPTWGLSRQKRIQNHSFTVHRRRQYTCSTMTDDRTRFVLPAAISIAILAVSTASIFIRFAQSEATPSIVIAALRLTFASLLLTPIVLTRHADDVRNFTGT